MTITPRTAHLIARLLYGVLAASLVMLALYFMGLEFAGLRPFCAVVCLTLAMRYTVREMEDER
jgi:hypothetical protein